MFAKSLLIRLPVSLALVLVAATAQAQEIGFVEDFALAADREKALATLVPGTEDFIITVCIIKIRNNSRRSTRAETMD
jgi:hypothetical protein